MIKTKVIVSGTHLTVVSTVQIPTRNTVGKLYSVHTFPVYNKKIEKFVSLKLSNNSRILLAVNRNSQFIEFKTFEINACEEHQSMTLCSSNKIWTDADQPSCIASIYFQQTQEYARRCDFSLQDVTENTPKPVHIDGGSYHYALASETAASYHCGDEGTKIEIMEGNGFFAVASNCNLMLNGHIIKNNMEYEQQNRSIIVKHWDAEFSRNVRTKTEYVK